MSLSTDAKTSATISGSGYYRDGCGAQNAVQSYRIVRHIGDRDDVLYPPEREVMEVAGVEETVDGVDRSTFSLTDEHDFARNHYRDGSTEGRTYYYRISVPGTAECGGTQVKSYFDPCQRTVTFNAANDASLAPMTVASMRSKSRASGVRLWWGPKKTDPNAADREFLIYRQSQMDCQDCPPNDGSGAQGQNANQAGHQAETGEWDQINSADWCNVRLGGAKNYFCVDQQVEPDTLYLYRILEVKNGVNSKEVSKQVYYNPPAPSSN